MLRQSTPTFGRDLMVCGPANFPHVVLFLEERGAPFIDRGKCCLECGGGGGGGLRMERAQRSRWIFTTPPRNHRHDSLALGDLLGEVETETRW